MEKKEILDELEKALPDLRLYELSEINVNERGAVEKCRDFFQKALKLFQMLGDEERKRCPRELVLAFRGFERDGIQIEAEDRGAQGASLKAPTWTLTIVADEQKFGVYTLGRVLVTEIKRALL